MSKVESRLTQLNVTDDEFVTQAGRIFLESIQKVLSQKVAHCDHTSFESHSNPITQTTGSLRGGLEWRRDTPADLQMARKARSSGLEESDFLYCR